MAKKPRVITLSELSVGEILQILGNPFCAGQLSYLRFGLNHRAAWEELSKNDNDYDRVIKYLNIVTNAFPPQLIDGVMKFMEPSVSRELVEDRFRRHFSEHDFKDWTDPNYTEDSEFQLFMDQLFQQVESKILVNFSNDLKLVKEKKETKKRASKRI